jgi:hypothetical protein
VKPLYVERDGETVYRPPYEQRDTFLTGWLVPSDKNSLQKILDQAFNLPSGGAVDYRPLSSAVLLSIANIRQIHSLDPRDSQRGWIPEVDVCVWILTGAFKRVNGRSELDHIAWYVPYIWVDNPYAVTTGRETVGYPKAIGWMQTPRDHHDPGPLWLDAFVLSPYSPQTELTRERILTLTRKPYDGPPLLEWAEDGADDVKDAFMAIAKLFYKFGDIHCDWDFFLNTFHNLLGGHMPLVFLKQFRDAATSDRACYQAIIEANATVKRFRRGGLLPGDWQLDLNQFDSLKIRDHLNVPASSVIDHGFWLDFTFSMDLGKEVWRAP